MNVSANLSAESGQCYAIAEHWASDLEFFNIESAFFHHLLEKHSVGSSSSTDLQNLKKLGKELRILDEERLKTEILVHEQLELISSVAKGIVQENLEKIEATHATLELLITELTKRYRELKKRLYAVFTR